MPPPTSRADLDHSLERLASAAATFARAPVRGKADLLRDVACRLAGIAASWVEAACRAKRIDVRAPVAGEEWTAGPMVVLRQIRLLASALDDVAALGAPRIDGSRVRTSPDGRAIVRTLPYDRYDRLLHRGVTADTWLDGPPERGLPRRAASLARPEPDGAVSLVLGAGNVASVPCLDVLQRMFVDGRVVLLKMSPVNDYLGPFFTRAFEPLISRGWLQIVYGGPGEGAYLCAHPAVDDVHITGARETHDLIVWGPPGPGREARRRSGDPLLRKRVTSELGNVTPVIVVPGPYSDEQVGILAESVAGMLVNNASFNCNAARVLLLPRGWRGRDPLIERLSGVLARVPARAAYYPGARDRYQRLVAGHEPLRTFGGGDPDALPWTLMLGLDAGDRLDDRFAQESFCPVLAEIGAGSPDPVEFLADAVRVANERLFGSLTAAVYVHPSTEADPALAAALETAIRELRYGVVAVNRWSAVAYASCTVPWGAHGGATLADAGSGIGSVHNTLMLDGVVKSVVRGGLAASPRPVWFPTHRRAHVLGRKLVRFEASPGWAKVPGIVAAAFRG